MPASSLAYDPSAMLLPSHRDPAEAVHGYATFLKEARDSLITRQRRCEMGWLDLPFEADMVRRIRSVVQATSKFKTLLVIGIGGSSLGARAILQALPSKKQVLFAGANTDPDELVSILASIDLRKTAVNVVSKSGDTIEPMATFLVVRDRLKKMVGARFADHIIATTDTEEGTLAEWSRAEGFHRLIVPRNVGGRFSVLSDAGLFPAAWAGIKIEDILAGAAIQIRQFATKPPAEQFPAVYAAIHADAYLKHHRHVFVLMPYAARLEAFALWYRQLIAESLGKAKNRAGLGIGIGPTPIAGLGATDQHSQIQLYMEGPADKVITFMEVKSFDEKLTVPAPPVMAAAWRALAGKTLEQLIHAERVCTSQALAENGRPHGTLFVRGISAQSMGELFQSFMIATAYLGELFDVNAFDQPGVEAGKRCLREWLRNA